MSATTAVKTGSTGRLGVMVRTPTEIFVYWRPVAGGANAPLTLRISDLTGRRAEELLDGRGVREMKIHGSIYIKKLLPGHIYLAEIGQTGPEGFTPLLAAGPVQTPWITVADSSDFPAPYHRS